MTNLYGIETTDDVELDGKGLPVGIYKAMIVGEEPEKNGKGTVAEYEVLDGPNKGKRGKQWINSLQDVWAQKNGITGEKMDDAIRTANIAKQNLRRIADATGKAVTPTSPLKGRVMTLDVQKQKKDPNYTEIKRYLPENHSSAGESF